MANRMMKQKKFVCLGGGIGTVNLIKGLAKHSDAITVILSMADEGGSAGRLRRLFKMPPPGDLVSCMAALADNKNLSQLLTYRFPGDRYGKDDALGGHKLGSLIMAALTQTSGSFEKAILLFKKMFSVKGTFMPATAESVTISAKTSEGKEIIGEEAIDLGQYNGQRVLERVFLHPANPKATPGVVKSLLEADAIIIGPGDLYTTLLPVLIVPEITEALRQAEAKKVFVINIANKPFETKGYTTDDYIHAVKIHLGNVPFEFILANDNFAPEIPKTYQYTYVRPGESKEINMQLVRKDLVDETFPLYHDPEKLAKAIAETI